MRENLIKVAINQFGERGFDGASTRDIASAANTTMSNITYHFGGKEGLFRAAAEAIVDRFSGILRVELGEMPDESASHEERVTMICSAIRALGRFTLSDEASSYARFVSREQVTSDSVMRDCFEAKMEPMTRVLGGQIAKARPDLDQFALRMTVFFLVSMAVSLRSSRLSLSIVMNVTEFDEELTERILGQLERSAREILEPKR